MSQLYDCVFFASKSVFASGTSAGAEQEKFVNREILLIEHSEKFLSNGAACAHYSYFHISFSCMQ